MKTAVNCELKLKANSEEKRTSKKIATKAYLKELCNKNYLRGNNMANSNLESTKANNDIEPLESNLIDLKNVKTNKELPIAQKIVNYVEQIKNPYLFKVGDITVKVNFTEDGPTFQDKFLSYLKSSSTK